MLQLRIEAELAAHPDRRGLAIDHDQRVALDDVLFEVEAHVLRRALQDRHRSDEVGALELAPQILRKLQIAPVGVDEDELLLARTAEEAAAWRDASPSPP